MEYSTIVSAILGLYEMERDRFEKYLKERYEDQVRWYSSRSSKNKRYYQWFQWTVIVISATVPVLIVSMPDQYKWITVLLSIVLTIATSALRSFKFQEYWVNYRTISETMKKEKYYYDAIANGYSTAEDKEQLFVERVETLISREKYIVDGNSYKKKGQKGNKVGSVKRST